MRVQYWSNTKLANWIRGTKKPKALELHAWDDWEGAAKQYHPVRYWIAETFLDWCQDVVHFVPDQLHNLCYWINRRFIDQSHIIKTGLSVGDWHETDEKILHGLMNELQTFVEVQKASMAWHSASFGREKNDHFVPWTEKTNYIRNLTDWRSQHYGVQHLLWEITLIKDEDWGTKPDDPEYGLPTHQAHGAMEVLELYVWWKFIRPMRKTSGELSGLDAYYDQVRHTHGGIFKKRDESEEEKASHMAMIHKEMELDAAYDQEDEDMLIRLIKIRKYLWT